MTLAARYAALGRQVFGGLAADESFLHPRDEAPPLAARGDLLTDEGAEAQIKSPLPTASDQAWTQFVRVMVVAPLGAVSDGNLVGMFQMTPRRLADIGILTPPRRSRNGGGKTIWVARFKSGAPSDFLKSVPKQYDAFQRSMVDYTMRMDAGEITRPESVSLSGALAVLHRAGPAGLRSWGGDSVAGFPAAQVTRKLYERVAGLF